MAEKDLKFNISADTSQATRNINTFNKSLNDTSTSSKNVASSLTSLKSAFSAFISVLAVAKITSFISESIKMNNESNRLTESLKSTMIANNKYSASFLKSADDLASAYQKITKFDDDAIKSGQKFLLLNKETTEKSLPQLTKLMLDYAEISGKSVEESGRTINRALSGQSRAFKELGIDIDQSKLKQMSAAEVIQLLNSKVANSAEAMGKTASGQLIIMGNAWGDVRKIIGRFFDDIGKNSGILDHLRKLIESFDKSFKDLNSSGETQKYGKLIGEIFNPLIDTVNFLIKHSAILKLGLELLIASVGGLVIILTTLIGIKVVAFFSLIGSNLTWTIGFFKNLNSIVPSTITLFTALKISASATFKILLAGFLELSFVMKLLIGSTVIGALLVGLYELYQHSKTVQIAIEIMRSGFIALAYDIGYVISQIMALANIKFDFTYGFIPKIDFSGVGESMAENNKLRTEARKQMQEESNKRILNPAKITSNIPEISTIPAIDDGLSSLSDINDKASKIEDINKKLVDKIKELTLSEYEYKKYLINEEYKNNIKSGADKIKSIELKNLEIRKLDDEEARIRYKSQKEAWDLMSRSPEIQHQLSVAIAYTKNAWKEFDDILNKAVEQESLIKIADQAWELSNTIADITIKNRNFTDKLFPSQETINAFKIKSLSAIRDIESEASKLKLEFPSLSGLIDETTSAKIKEINKNTTEEIYSGWKDLTESITNNFADAFEEILMTGELNFANLGKSIQKSMASVLTDMVKTNYIKPFMSQMTAGIQGNLVPAGSGPLQAGQQYAPSWMGNYGNQIYKGVAVAGSAASLIQQQQAGTLTPASGLVQGAMAGAMFGPVGMMAGAAIGGLIGSFSKKAKEVKIPGVELLWEVVDGQIKLIGDQWKNSTKSQEVIDEVQKSLQSQIDFARQISVAAGQKLSNFTIGGGSSDLSKTGAAGGSPLEIGLMTYSAHAAIFGKQFAEDFTKEFIGAFQDRVVFAIGPYTEEMWNEMKGAAYTKVKGTTASFSLTKWITYEMEKINKLTTDAEKLAEYQRVSNIFYYTKITGEGGGTLSQLADPKAFVEWMSTLQEKFQQITSFFGESLSTALMNSLNSGNYKSFEQNLRNSLSSTIKNAIIQGFLVNEILPKVLQSFKEQTFANPIHINWEAEAGESSGVITSTIPALWDIISQYQSGQISLNEANAYIAYMTDTFNTQMTGINDLLPPLIESLLAVNTTLGDNTGAVISNTGSTNSNTSAILGPVNDFLKSLTFGQFAPSMSTSQIMAEQAKLFSATVANSEMFSQYADFMTSTALPYLQGTSENYQSLVESIKAQATSLPWYTDTTSSIDDVANKNADAIARRLLPALSELNESLKEGQSVVVVDSEGQIVKTVYKSLKNNSNIRSEIKSIAA